MSNTPTASSVVHDGEPGTLRPAALPAGKGLSFEKVKPVEPSLNLHVYDDYGADITKDQWNAIAIRLENEKRRERIARRLEP